MSAVGRATLSPHPPHTVPLSTLLTPCAFPPSSHPVPSHPPQRTVYQNVIKVPAELQELIDESTFTKSRHYQLDKSSYGLVYNLFKQIEFLVSSYHTVLMRSYAERNVNESGSV